MERPPQLNAQAIVDAVVHQKKTSAILQTEVKHKNVGNPTAGSVVNTNTKQARLNIRCKSNNLIRDQLGSFSPQRRLAAGNLKFNFVPGNGGTNRNLLQRESGESKRNSNNEGSVEGRYARDQNSPALIDKKKNPGGKKSSVNFQRHK